MTLFVINGIICRSFACADIQCVKEQAVLSRLDEKRPDGLALIPWKFEKCAACQGRDVTISDTILSCHTSLLLHSQRLQYSRTCGK